VKFVRTKDVLQMLGVSRTTLWRMVQSGAFPKPVLIASRATGHVLAEVEAWMESRTDSQPREEGMSAARPGPRTTLAMAKHVSRGETPSSSSFVSAGPHQRRRRGLG
jgi:prophage regulatory protein